MGGMQGDDLQLQGDMACENAEIRGELKVAGVPITPGGGTTVNAMVYACTGAEGDDFVVPFSFVRPAGVSYVASAGGAGLTDMLTFDLPQANYTAVSVRVLTSAAVQAGDNIAITVVEV